MNRQTLLIIAIISGGSILSGLAYGVTNGTIVVGNLTVTGTCTGCGGGEGTFTTYSLLTNTTSTALNIAFTTSMGSTITNTGAFIITNDLKTAVYNRAGALQTSYDATNGDVISTMPTIAQSTSGTYAVAVDYTAQLVRVYTNSTALTTITLDNTHSYDATIDKFVSISPNGKYILIFGADKTDTTKARIQLWQGS